MSALSCVCILLGLLLSCILGRKEEMWHSPFAQQNHDKEMYLVHVHVLNIRNIRCAQAHTLWCLLFFLVVHSLKQLNSWWCLSSLPFCCRLFFVCPGSAAFLIPRARRRDQKKILLFFVSPCHWGLFLFPVVTGLAGTCKTQACHRQRMCAWVLDLLLIDARWKQQNGMQEVFIFF